MAAAAGLVLAAGEGRRFGQPKAVVEVEGERLVDRAVRLLADGGCHPVIVVDGAVRLEAMESAVSAPSAPSAEPTQPSRRLDVPTVRVVHNPRWPDGMGTSLHVGLDALRGADVGAVVVALVDQPWLSPEAVRRLRAARDGGAFVAVPIYGGQRGNPVLLGREVWDDVLELAKGDVGARAYMKAHPELVTAVPCDGIGSPDDIDYPDDLTFR
ncbi:nucleotidyltransferase family protein [Actinobacteria bacterium YIM 96077]|uniref:Nucleotidyltransferase family protein n=1 Tax=Phytoactinopolyspora halophila TaxID=1981511 RepID=A0A329QM99_9ACTN|nr:nucleotidyltransferase family protein [Actinobacteria bacterium YIM 96077]RAW13286.1 nucleotidyltransferase family protein [Phytoactinopolyspora halophila]